MLKKSRVTGWHWVMQRVSALFLTVGLALHFLVLHFAKLPGGDGKVMSAPVSTGVRFVSNTRFWVCLDTMLLAFGLYHGLNGVYNIIMDYNPSPPLARKVAWAMWIVGIVLFALGFVLIGRFVGYAFEGGFPVKG
jgi:succinate dehydrogenase / fumarate reductase, membrane anchor subunit